MARPSELTQQFRRMPLDLTILYASNARSFVDTVIVRWATGQFVPDRCTPQLVADLARQADLADHVITLRGLVEPSDPAHELKLSTD